jgi:hypothetical protein
MPLTKHRQRIDRVKEETALIDVKSLGDAAAEFMNQEGADSALLREGGAALILTMEIVPLEQWDPCRLGVAETNGFTEEEQDG